MQAFVNNYKSNDQEYIKFIKSIEDKVRELLPDKKNLLNTSFISLIEAMRNDPEKHSALVYHNNGNVAKQSAETMPSLLPALPLEGEGGAHDDNKTKHNNQEEQQEMLNDQEYQTDDQYEQNRLTNNTNSKYFEDGEYEADRLTDDYQEDFTD